MSERPTEHRLVRGFAQGGVILALWLFSSQVFAQTQEQRIETKVGVLTKAPVLLAPAPATYPVEAKPEKLNAEVVLELTIEADGTVGKVSVTKGAGHGFDEAAVAAAKQMRFTPAEIDHRAAAIRIAYTQHFTFAPPEEPASQAASASAPVSLAEAASEPELAISLSGKVREQGTRGLLEGASILVTREADNSLPEVLVESDGKGQFALRLAPGTYTITVFEVNHEKFVTKEKIATGQRLEVTYYLRPKAGPFETVVVGEREKKEVTRYTLTRQELETTPGSFGDPIRVLQDFPGVARAPLLLGQLLVRGSGPNDTGAYIDGIELPILFHFFAGPSVVDPEFVEKLDFYTGGFGAEYGRAIGGLVEIETRKPVTDQVHGSASVSTLGADAYLSVPIAKDLTISGSGRRSYYDLVLPLILKASGSDVTLSPVYDDYQLRLDYHLTNTHHSFQLALFGSDDKLSAGQTANATTTPFTVTENTNFLRSAAFWTYDGAKLKSRAQVWFGTNDNGLSLNSDVANEHDVVGGARERVEFSPLAALKLRTGFELLWTHVSNQQDGPPPSNTYEPLPGRGSVGAPVLATSGYYRSDSALWAEGIIKLPAGFSLIPSLRGDLFDLDDHLLGAFDPRLTLREDFDWHGASAVKAAVGLYHEPAYPAQLNPVFGNPTLPLQQAIQSSLGAEHSFTDRIYASLTGFYNYYSDLAEASRAVSINSAGTPVPLNYRPSGEIRAFGVEVLARHELSRHFYGWLAYTFSFSELHDPELVGGNGAGFHPSPYDERHILTLVGQYRWDNGWMVGARFRLTSGTPTTVPVGATFQANAQAYSEIPGSYNGSSLPIFNQLDVRIDKQWVFRLWQFGVYLDIQNIYNASNPQFIAYDYRYRTSEAIASIPFLPTLGVQARF